MHPVFVSEILHCCDVIMSEIHFNEKPEVTEILQSSGSSV